MIRIFKCAAIVLLLSVCVFVSAEEIVEAIVAVVNNDYISLSVFKEKHDAFYQLLRAQFQGEQFTKRYEEIKENLMDMIITDLLLLQKAREMGLDVQQQLREQIERFKEMNGFASDEELVRALNQQGMDYDEWRQDFEENLLRQSVLYYEVGRSIVIDDSEIVGYYNQNREQFRQPEEYTLKAIYLSSEGRTEQEAAARKAEIDGKITAGEDLSSLAAEYGEGPEKDTQGDLGSFKKGDLAPDLEQAVVELQAGELSPWIKMPGGWYLLRLEEKKESRIRSFEEVRDEVERQLFEEKNEAEVNKYMKELKEGSFIKILIPKPLEIR